MNLYCKEHGVYAIRYIHKSISGLPSLPLYGCSVPGASCHLQKSCYVIGHQLNTVDKFLYEERREYLLVAIQYLEV